MLPHFYIYYKDFVFIDRIVNFSARGLVCCCRVQAKHGAAYLQASRRRRVVCLEYVLTSDKINTELDAGQSGYFIFVIIFIKIFLCIKVVTYECFSTKQSNNKLYECIAVNIGV